MKRMYKINIVPNTSLWMKLGRTKYTIPKAIGELIDNSIDNAVDDNVKVDIHFAIEGDCIGILDNGSGMNVDTLTRALTIAEHIEDKGKIGEHGFGLESASSYLGKNLTIYTKTEEMNKYLKFNYNQADFLNKNEWTIDYQYISKKTLIEETGLAFDRGTYIRIDDLNVRLYKGLISLKGDNQDGTMISKFQSIYKKFIEKDILNLTIHVEKRKGVVDHIKIEAPNKQNLAFKVNFNFKFKNNNKELSVSGWAGILDFYDENRKNKKKYTSGFDVISKNKVILQHIHPGYSYHPEKRLVLGEMELENFQTTSDKTDFIRNSDWQALELILNQYVTKPILYLASTAYLNNLNEKVNNNESFDLNLDFDRVLMRTALNEFSLNEFTNELTPVVLLESNTIIEEDIFDDAKEKIIKYMKNKKTNNSITTRNTPSNSIIGLETVATIDNIDNQLELPLSSNSHSLTNASIKHNSFLDGESSNELDTINKLTGKSMDYNITFNHQGLIIKHELTNINDGKMYDFELDINKGIIVVKSNKSAFCDLYSNLESFCVSNIINSIIDNSIIKASEENELNKELVLTIKSNVMKSFVSNQNLFKTYNNISI